MGRNLTDLVFMHCALLAFFSTLLLSPIKIFANDIGDRGDRGDIESAADEATLIDFQVKPDRCIALRQGQVCYQKVSFTWSPQLDRALCLIEKGKEEPLECWSNNIPHQFKFSFEADSEKTYQLQEQQSSVILAEVKISVAWVYKNSEKVSTGWRLF